MGDEPRYQPYLGEGYWRPFGAVSADDIHTYWQKLTDFSRASRDEEYPYTRWDPMKLFDGQHAVG